MTPKPERAASNRNSLGSFGERVAALHLEAKGYRIIERNAYLVGGELDIVAMHDHTTVFVEVRTRRGSQAGLPEESITPRKAAKLLAVASEFLERHEGLPRAARIDMIAVGIEANGIVSRITHIEDIISG